MFIFQLMNRAGYAPKLYATFENGLAYEYIQGDVLTIETCRDKTVYPLVATMLAKMHKLRFEDLIHESRRSNIWTKSELLIDLIPDSYPTAEKQSRFVFTFITFLDNEAKINVLFVQILAIFFRGQGSS